jgi:hypothetical protein
MLNNKLNGYMCELFSIGVKKGTGCNLSRTLGTTLVYHMIWIYGYALHLIDVSDTFLSKLFF